MSGLFETTQRPKRTGKELATLGEINEAIRNLGILFEEENQKEISVNNFDEIKLHLRNELTLLAKKIGEYIASIKIPDVLKADEFPTLISTIKTLQEAIAKIDFTPTFDVQIPEIDVKVPEIKASEIKVPKIKIPNINVPEPHITVNPEIDLDFSELLAALEPLRFLSDKATKPLSVRLSDGKRFISALKTVSDKVVRAFAAGGMTSAEWKSAYKSVAPDICGAVGTLRKAVTTAGTKEQVTSTSTSIKYCLICGDTGNTDLLVAGDSNVVAAASSQRGTVIIPGNVPVRFEIDNLNKLYVDSIVNGEAICVTHFS